MGIKRERPERRRSTAGGTGKMKDAGGVQQKRDDAGDAKQAWRDRRGEAGVAEGWITKGRTGAHGADFPFSGTAHQNSFHPPAQGKDLPVPGQGGSRSWGVGQEPPLPPLFPAPTARGWVLGAALPSPSLPGPGSPGSPQGAWQDCKELWNT